jgi:hypothetical protein
MEEWWRTAATESLEERWRTTTAESLEITAWFPQRKSEKHAE